MFSIYGRTSNSCFPWMSSSKPSLQRRSAKMHISIKASKFFKKLQKKRSIKTFNLQKAYYFFIYWWSSIFRCPIKIFFETYFSLLPIDAILFFYLQKTCKGILPIEDLHRYSTNRRPLSPLVQKLFYYKIFRMFDLFGRLYV